MSFYLVMLEPDGDGGVKDVVLSDYGPYEKGSEAATHAKRLTAVLGQKIQPRRISQAGDWRARWTEKIKNGELKPLPKKWDLKPIEGHFAHLDCRDETKIGYIENDELGAIDRVTPLSPGRYISRFYPEIDDNHRRTLIALIDPNDQIYLAKTPEEITYVYKNGPESCMDGSHSFLKELPCWPTAVYGAGDLAVAYTKNGRGRIQSRAVVWPEKKLYGRLYGDVQRLRASLEAEGYTSLADQKQDPGLFIGARILKVPSKDNPFNFILPYFDNITYVVDKGDHFVSTRHLDTTDKTIRYCHGGGTNGVSSMQRYCPRLENWYEAYDFKFVNGAEQEWSGRAIRSYAFTCEGSGEIWSDHFKVRLAGGHVWSKKYFEQHGAYCAASNSPARKIDLVDAGGGRMVLKEYINLLYKAPPAEYVRFANSFMTASSV